MKIGPGDTTVQSQIQAQLAANQRADAEAVQPRPRFPQPAAPETLQSRDTAQTVQDRAGNRPLSPQARRDANPGVGPQGSVQTSTQRALTLLDPDVSSVDELEDAEARVGSLFGREAPAGRTSAQVEENTQPILGQIVDIRV